MPATPHSRARRVFRLLLRLFPFEFRGDFGDDMEEVFMEQRRDVSGARQKRQAVGLWWRTLTGIVRTAPAQHLDVLAQDLTYALRTLRRNPLFSLAAVLTLALGLGATTAIFTAVDSLLWRPLPVSDADRLLLLTEDRGGGSINHNFSYPDYLDQLDRNHAFEGVIAYCPSEQSVSSANASERVRAELVSETFFPVLGLRPRIGRTFTAREATRVEDSQVVVLGDALWRRLFPSEAPSESRSILVNGRPFTVVGVMSPTFVGMSVGERAEMWVPLVAEAYLEPSMARAFTSRSMNWLTLLGRMRPGVSGDAAARATAAVERQVAADLGVQRPRTLRLSSGRQGDSILPQLLRRPLMLVAGVVGLVLALVCANVAGLLLARASARRREMSMRAALGAGGWRLLRQLLTESLVLAALGGASGLLVAWWCARLLASVLSPGPAPLAMAGLDARVLGFACAVTLATGLIFGFAPALHAISRNLTSALHGGAGSAARRSGRFFSRQALVTVQVALSVMLLVPAGLLLRTLYNVTTVDVGVDRHDMVLLSLDLESAGYDHARGPTLYRDVRERLQALPGVSGVAIGTTAPVSAGGSRMSVSVAGYQPRADEDMDINFSSVDTAYFRTLGIRLLRGRLFSDDDRKDSRPVAVINETMARRFWGGNPVGRMIGFDGPGGPFTTEVIGVVSDAKYRSLREAATASFYLPFAQLYRPRATLHVRVNGRDKVLPAIRRAVLGLDRRLALFDVRTMDEQVALAASEERLAATLCAAFAAIALMLSLVGLGGVVSYLVSQRTREIGIRMALGARANDVRRAFLAHGIALVGIGVAIGLAGGIAVARAIASLLFGVQPLDPISIAAPLALLVAGALAACDIPARRAARIDPAITLRSE